MELPWSLPNPRSVLLVLLALLLSSLLLLSTVQTSLIPVRSAEQAATLYSGSLGPSAVPNSPVSVSIEANQLLSAAPRNELNRAEEHRWQRWAIDKLWEERAAMGYTPVVRLEHLPHTPNLTLLFKNESASRSGNLKHRFAWALFMWALLEGLIRNGTTVYEASSGNTAFSEMHMARLIGVPFTAIIPETTEPAKEGHIQRAGGKVIKVPYGEMQSAARQWAEKDENGFFMNQFGNADHAEEFHRSRVLGGEWVVEFLKTQFLKSVKLCREAGEHQHPP